MKCVAIIGGGPAGLSAAEAISLAGSGVLVTVYDRMPSLARKLLMAGRGGLNLTHSENIVQFLSRYGASAEYLRPAFEALPPEVLRSWCEGLGQPTFVGSSGRVFPRSMKASPLLRAWLRRLGERGVSVNLRHQWLGWRDDGANIFDTQEGQVADLSDATILALGGGSWSRLGSDGSWVDILRAAGVSVAPLKASNCGFLVSWTDLFRERFRGHHLKRISIRFEDAEAHGEAVVTADGLQGGPVYTLSAALREAIDRRGAATVRIDLRRDLTLASLARRLEAPRGKQSLSTFLRKTVRLSPVAIGLLFEASLSQGLSIGELGSLELAMLIKSLPVRVEAVAPIDRAISTSGGVSFAELDADLMLIKRPGVFVAGEMLDWDAPTGGYLLQATFATGAAAGRGALKWLSRAGLSA